MHDIALTIDLEDWFDGLGLPPGKPQVEQQTDWLLRCFDDAGVHATFFVLGTVADRHPQLIKRIAKAGHEIAFHGGKHQFLSQVGRTRFARELGHYRPLLQDLSGQSVSGYRAPYFSLTTATRWALDSLIEAGLEYDASIYPGLNDRYGWPGAPREPTTVNGSDLVIFPVPLMRWPPVAYSGGAYLRILPEPIIEHAISRQLAAGSPAMIYAHPFEVAERLPWCRQARLRANLTRHLFRDRFRNRFRNLVTRWASRIGPMQAVIAGLGKLPDWRLDVS